MLRLPAVGVNRQDDMIAAPDRVKFFSGNLIEAGSSW
jgi:hypothetical protein